MIRVPARALVLQPALPARLAVRAVRAVSDPHVLLALALIVPVVAVQVIVRLEDWVVVLAAATGFLALQLGLGRLRRRVSAVGLALVRLSIATMFVTVASRFGPAGSDTPAFLVLSIPVVVFAAMLGARAAAFVGLFALTGYLLAAGSRHEIAPEVLERGITVATTTAVLVVGTRRTVLSLERALRSARHAMAADRRRGRQLAAIEAVGALLAQRGPTAEALDGVIDLLVARLGYRFASVYLGDGDRMRLGAQRGHERPIVEFAPGVGVLGRVMRTGGAELVEDVRADADYVDSNDRVQSLVSVPLVVDGDLVGVVNVESARPRRLDDRDLALLRLVADRLASALALAREREGLARRVAAFERLTTYGQAMTATLELDALYARIPTLVSGVVPCDGVTLAIGGDGGGEYRIVAMSDDDRRLVGRSVRPGESITGRAIAERRVIVEGSYRPTADALPPTAGGSGEFAVAAVPLVNEDRVIGAIVLGRHDRDRPFDALDLELLPLIGSHAALAIANARLHSAAAEASIRDPLTSLHNRRHLDASLERMSALRARARSEERRPVSVALFDLDQFGRFNKRYGHAAGDEVLRTFARILRRRTRASDLVARFGGEEFVVVLDGATRAEAVRFAEEIRETLAAGTIEGPHGEELRATVSAGCAGLERETARVEALLEIADVGLAMAKQAGRNRVVAA